MARTMGKIIQSRGNETVFPNSNGQNKDKTQLNFKANSCPIRHGETNAYLHRFNLREDAMYICNIGDQTMDHILFQCVESRKQKELTKLQLRTKKKWPVNKLELITKHIQRIY